MSVFKMGFQVNNFRAKKNYGRDYSSNRLEPIRGRNFFQVKFFTWNSIYNAVLVLYKIYSQTISGNCDVKFHANGASTLLHSINADIIVFIQVQPMDLISVKSNLEKLENSVRRPYKLQMHNCTISSKSLLSMLSNISNCISL